MKVNFGCGQKKLEGYVNVDFNVDCVPDQILDLNRLPYYSFKDESLDEALWDNVLEHLLVELPNWVNEMRRILKPNGLLKVVSPNCFKWKARLAFLQGCFRQEHGWHINHSFLLKPSELKRYLELSGFEVKGNSSDLFAQEINFIARKRA